MNWVQEKYRPKVLIQLSTLTGAIVTALGDDIAGLFSNDKKLSDQLKDAGNRVNELVWELPVTKNHKKMITPKHCDLTNNSGKDEAKACQAAAFLKEFVQNGVSWAHIDIGGAAFGNLEGTGWGARILIQYIHKKTSKI